MKWIVLMFLMTGCKSGPDDIGHELGVLECKMFKTQMKVKAGKPKIQKAAKKEYKTLVKEHEKMTAKIGKMNKKNKKIAEGARKDFSKNCRL